jgi:hypothetical protein
MISKLTSLLRHHHQRTHALACQTIASNAYNSLQYELIETYYRSDWMFDRRKNIERLLSTSGCVFTISRAETSILAWTILRVWPHFIMENQQTCLRSSSIALRLSIGCFLSPSAASQTTLHLLQPRPCHLVAPAFRFVCSPQGLLADLSTA